MNGKTVAVKGDKHDELQALLERVFKAQREKTAQDIERFKERERKAVA